QHALALDDLVLFGIEGGSVILEVLNQRSRLWSFVKNLRLAFVDAATSAHGSVPWLEKIHDMPWLRFSRFEVPRRRTIGAALRERPCTHAQGTHAQGTHAQGAHARVYSSTTVHSTSRTCKLAHSRLEYN